MDKKSGVWVVYNQTNYGRGVYFAGAYRSKERAFKRLAWCKEHLSGEDDWNIALVPNKNLTDEGLI